MDISKLTREQKIQRYEALQEKRRRLLSRKTPYNPNDGQLQVHKDNHPIRLVTSGNGSGKSTLLVHEVWWKATGYNPVTQVHSKVPARIAVVLDSPTKIEEVFLQEMRKWYTVDELCEIQKKGKPYPSEVVFKNGSKISFLMHLMEPLALEGLEFDAAFFDEPPPRQVFLAVMRGNRRRGSTFNALIIGTPIAAPWLYSDLYMPAIKREREDIGVHRFGTEVNRKNLSDGYIENFAKNLTDQERRVRLEGEFFHLGGLALAHLFKREQHVVPDFDWPQGKPVVIAIDPHPSKSHVALMCGATGDGRIYVIKEFSSRAPPRALARELQGWSAGYRVVDIVVDSLGNTPMSGGEGNRSFIEVLNSTGLRCRATSYEDKSDAEWMDRIKDVLEIPDSMDNLGRRQPKLGIMARCENIQLEIETVTWLKHRGQDLYKEKLDITNRDYLACLKYALATDIAYLANRGSMPKVKRAGKSAWSGG